MQQSQFDKEHIEHSREDSKATRHIREEIFKDAYLQTVSPQLSTIGADFAARGQTVIQTHVIAAGGGHFSEFLMGEFQKLLAASGKMTSISCVQSDLYPELLVASDNIKTIPTPVNVLINSNQATSCVTGEKCDLIVGQMLLNLFNSSELKKALNNLSNSLNEGGYLLFTLDRKPDPQHYGFLTTSNRPREDETKSDLALKQLEKKVDAFCKERGFSVEITDAIGRGFTPKEVVDKGMYNLKGAQKITYDYSTLKTGGKLPDDQQMIETEYRSTIILIHKPCS